jgi:prepilin-type N-terminal cleavage/methylation domain-containing protein
MKQWATQKRSGFTIVELLIVIVVIAILAAITLVAYNGIRERAQDTQIKSALAQAQKKVLAYAAEHSDVYPETLADAGINDTANAVYQYSSDNSVSPRRYALTATNGTSGSLTYYVSNTQQKATTGIAPGHNTIAWYENDPASPLPFGGTPDTSQFRTGTKSLRLGPGDTGNGLRGSSYAVTTGQTYTVNLWVKSDANWNGTSNNSKIRFGDTSGGTGPVAVCGYGGVKANWTQVNCSYTVPSSITSISISVGNDGSVGNIYIDDISLAIE